MNTQLTAEQALQNLYQASTFAKLTASEHQVLAESAKVLQDIIASKKEVKEDEQNTTSPQE